MIIRQRNRRYLTDHVIEAEFLFAKFIQGLNDKIATWRCNMAPVFIQFTGCEEQDQFSYYPEEANEWLRLWE